MGERFPKLPVIWIESGLAWIPFLMQRLDHEYMLRPSEAPLLEEEAVATTCATCTTPRSRWRSRTCEALEMHLPHDQRGDAAPLLVRLSALGLRSAVARSTTCRSSRRRPSTTSSAAPRRGCSSCRRATRSSARTLPVSAISPRRPDRHSVDRVGATCARLLGASKTRALGRRRRGRPAWDSAWLFRDLDCPRAAHISWPTIDKRACVADDASAAAGRNIVDYS